MRSLTKLPMVVTLILTMGTAPAFADPAETFAFHYDMTEIDDPLNPCVAVINAVAEVNAVVHETINGNGGHFTLTETGTTTGETPTGESVVAHYTFWVGANNNANTGSFHGVATLTADGTVDGEPFKFNLRDQFDGGGGTITYNCHDGSGPQSFDYSI